MKWRASAVIAATGFKLSFNLLYRKCLEVRNICQFLHYGGHLRASMIFRSMKTRGSFIRTSEPADRTSILA